MKTAFTPHKWAASLTCLILSILLFGACQKDSNSPENSYQGEGRVSIHFNGIGQKAASAKVLRNSLSNTQTAPAVQKQTFQAGGLYFTATLTEDGSQNKPSYQAKRMAASAQDQGRDFAGDYRIAIYPKGEVSGDPIQTFTFHSAAAVDPIIDIAAGEYTFVTTAYMHPEETGADRDPLAATQEVTVTADHTEAINITLLHKLTEVKVRFDASAVGDIQDLAGGTVAPNKAYEFNENTGEISSWGNDLAPQALNFTGQSGPIWTSAPVIIATDGHGRAADGKNVIHFDAIKINNITPDQAFDFFGPADKPWELKPGTQYTLTIRVGDEDLGGIEAGGFIWAPGNLVYNANGQYSFAAANEFGDNWFFNWLTPAGVGTEPADAYAMVDYDVQRDPCQLVNEAWYTPTAEQYTALIAEPGVATDYQYWNNGVGGVFYGTTDLQAASQNPGDYLFFIGQTGYANGQPAGTSTYWSSTVIYGASDDVNAGSIIFGGYHKPTAVATTDDKTNTFQIRCVRDAN